MNIKKVFASLTGVLMLATTVTPLVTGAASYGAELEGAYKYAFEKGITTMASIDSANMYGEITRGQLAKMISNWAEAELGQKADATKVCSFTDEGTAEGDLAMYLKKSCQMGLMGQGIAAFRPNAKVTRGEFGTTLSRALWGDKYNTTATPYYVNHLQALKDAGIMTRIETPAQLEIRGYVMLMLQRAVAKKDVANCADPMVALACSVGKDCPAACKKVEEKKDEVVKAGDLAVSAQAAEGRKALIGGVSDLDTLIFKTSEKVEVSRITLERYGYSTIDQVKSVQLEDEDGNVIADARELNSRGQVSLAIKRGYRTVDGTYKATVVVTTNDLAKDGSTLGFKVVAAESTAKNLNLSNYDPYTYDLVSYDGSKLEFSSRNSATKNHNWEANKPFEVAKFRVKAPADASILVKGFTLTDAKNNAIQADKYAKDVKVTVNGKEVKGLKWNINKDDELVLSFDEVEVAGKETANFVVSMSFSEEYDNFGDVKGVIQYKVANITKFNAVDKKTGTRVSENDNKKLESVTWTTYTFNGGKIKLSGIKLGTVSAAANSRNVLIAEGQITITEPVRGTVTLRNPDQAKDFIEEITLVINGEEYDVSNKAQENFTFNGVEIQKSGKVELRVDLKDTANGTKEFTTSLTSNAFALRYDVSGETVDANQIAGSISISRIRAEAPKATLENKLTKEVELIQGETNRKLIFDGTYTAKKGAVTLKSFKVKSTAASQALNIAPVPRFYVTVNGEEYDATHNLSGDIDDIKVEAGKSVPVKVEIELVPTNADQTNTFNLAIDGEDVDNNPAGTADEDTVKVVTRTQGTLELASANANNTILLKSNRTIAEFRVKPAKAGTSEVSLKSMDFDFVGIDDADIKVEVNGEVIPVSATASEYQPDIIVPADGVMVKVSLKSEPDTAKEVGLTLASINGKTNVKTTFNRYYVPATLKITQRKTTEKTYYSIKIENDGSEVVKNVQLFTGNTAVDPVVKTQDDKALASSNDDEMSVSNDEGADIAKVEYMVGTTKISITKEKYGDFFKKADAQGNDLVIYSKN